MNKKEHTSIMNGLFHEYIKYSLDSAHYKLQISKPNKIFHTDIPWHYHKDFEFAYILSRNVLYKSQSQELILNEGDAVFINSNVIHMLHPLSPDGSLRMIIQFFDTSFIAGFPGTSFDLKYIQPVQSNTNFDMLPFYAHNANDRHYIDLLLRAAEAASGQDPFREIDIRNIFSDIWKYIFTTSSNCSDQSNRSKNNIKYDMLKKAISYIHLNYNKDITVSKIAEHINISERECYRLFQEIINTTPNKILLTIRLQYVAESLTHSGKSIAEIASDTGFSSASYLGKCFKNTYGITPNEYRTHIG